MTKVGKKNPALTGRNMSAQREERSYSVLGNPSQNTTGPDAVEEGRIFTLRGIVQPRRGKSSPADHPGLPYIGLEHVEAHTTRLLGTVAATEMKSTANRFHPGDVLYSRLRPYLNKVWRADREGLCSSEFIVMPGNDRIDAAYLCYRLNSPDFVSFANSLNAGDRPRVDFEQISTFQTWLPNSLPEQRRIVAEIEKQFTRLETGVAALRRVQANLKRYRAAVLKAACEGRLVPTEAELQKSERRGQKSKARYETGAELLTRILNERRQNWQGRGKYKEPAAPDTAKLPVIPAGWKWLTVETIGFVTKLAGFEYTKYVKYSPDGDLAVIKAENAGRSGFKRTEISRIKSSTVAQLTRSQLKAGDLLMVFVGAGTGNVARVPDDQPYFLGPNIAMIRVDPNFVSEAYLEMFLRSPVGHSLTFGFIKAVAQPSLSMGTIRMIPVALPPLAEQTRIVAEVERRLSVVEELESVVTANLQRATRLRQSILQKAFSGKL